MQRISEAFYDKDEGVVFPLKPLFDKRQQELVYAPEHNEHAFDLPPIEGEEKEDTDSGPPTEPKAAVEGGNADESGDAFGPNRPLQSPDSVQQEGDGSVQGGGSNRRWRQKR